MAPIISTENLCHKYSIGTPFEHVALDNVNFSAEPDGEQQDACHAGQVA